MRQVNGSPFCNKTKDDKFRLIASKQLNVNVNVYVLLSVVSNNNCHRWCWPAQSCDNKSR